MIRRRALLGALPLLAAPAIVRPSLLMRLSTALWRPAGPVVYRIWGLDERGEWMEEYATLNDQWQGMLSRAQFREVNGIEIIANPPAPSVFLEAEARHDHVLKMREMEAKLAASFRQLPRLT